MATSERTYAQPQSFDRSLLIRKTIEKVAVVSVALCAFLAVAVLGVILAYVLYRGISAIDWQFITALPAPLGEERGGIANAIAGSFLIVGMASLAAIPLGLGAAIFINEFTSPVLGRVVRFLAEVLTAVPSIVIGIFAYVLIVAQSGGFSGYSGAAAYAFIMVPIIVISAQEALRLVPQSLREASLALGIPKWRTIVRVVVPVAQKALLTGSLLAIARAMGETAPMMFTAFGNQFWNLDPSKPMATVPLVIYRYAIGPYDEWHRQAWAASFLLVVIVLGISVMTRFAFRSKYGD